MVFVPGGKTEIVYQGERWKGFFKQTVRIGDFCIDKYEASQPDATKTSFGSWRFEKPVPAARSVKGVLPWHSLSWEEAAAACEKAGKRLPTLAEWQTAFSGYEGAQWPWGSGMQDHTCYAGMSLGPYPTGGCCYEVCANKRCFTTCDMIGNLSEWVDATWDESCYGTDGVVVAGGSCFPMDGDNIQYPDPEKPGCWKVQNSVQSRWGLHFHSKHNMRFDDDGFRCVLSR